MYIGGMLACNIVCATLLYVLRCTFFIRSESISHDLQSNACSLETARIEECTSS
jgi:hypothetical protein